MSTMLYISAWEVKIVFAVRTYNKPAVNPTTTYSGVLYSASAPRLLGIIPNVFFFVTSPVPT